MMQKISIQNSDVIIQTGARNAGGVPVGKIAFIDRSRSLRLRRLTAGYLCPSATVVHIHEGALAKEYAVSKFDDHSYDTCGPVDIKKVGCIKVC